MRITVRNTDLRVLNMRTRMPFRYGIASMTALPHLFVRCTIAVDGTARSGIAADGLPPKWFTKDPHTTYRDDLADMVRVVEKACALAQQVEGSDTVFGLWQAIYRAQMRWAAGEGHPPLLAGFGASLVERALLDAFCRATGVPFAEALRRNTPGLRLGEMHAELGDHSPAELLPARPLRTIIARHTVGLADHLTEADIPPAERLDDGLPQSLEACIRAYGLTHFKIKLCGDTARDTERLVRIARLLEATATDYAFTLDGNEQYHAVAPFQTFWQALQENAALAPFLRRLLFVEQPLHRHVALNAETRRALTAWKAKPPLLIDESDAETGSLPAALECGYIGTSYKNCKGVFKGIANACLLAHRQRADPAGRHILSGEDLANVGPVALLQDLAALASLGVEHAERNGHHYFRGLSMLPEAVQAQAQAHHADLYRRHERGFATLDIRGGAVAVASVVEAPFGIGFALDTTPFTPLAEWVADSLSDALSE
jgi:L-alanine-DL-glutamate epimerase-like enolase superfamily enzyme